MKKTDVYQFPFESEKFFSDVADWTAEEVGVHIRLMCHQWKHGSIPIDARKVAQIAGISTRKLKIIWPLNLERKYLKVDENRMANPKLQRTRSKVESMLKVKSEAGKKGAKVRWQTHNSVKEN